MKTVTKILLIAASVFLVGALIFLISLAAAGWRLGGLSSTVSEERTYNESEENEIKSIEFDVENVDVIITFGEEFSVKYPEIFTSGGKPVNEIKVSDTGGAFKLTEKTTWHFGLSLDRYVIYVTLPSERACDVRLDGNNGDVDLRGTGTVSSLFINLDNGDVEISGGSLTSLGDINVTTDNGDVDLGTFSAKSVTVETNNGEIDLQGGTASEKVKLGTDNGDVELSGRLTAASVEATTDNGEISFGEGEICADKIILSTDNGEIEAKILGRKSDYTITVDSDLGDSNIVNQSGGSKILEISSDIGDIEIHFVEN